VRTLFTLNTDADEVKAMHKRQSLLIGIAAAAAVPFVLGTALQAAEPAKAQKAAEGTNVGVGEQGIAGVIVPGPAITANDFMSKQASRLSEGHDLRRMPRCDLQCPR
jgi:purine-cytosine permease-like protein